MVLLTVEQPFEVRASCTAAARCCAYMPAPAVHCSPIKLLEVSQRSLSTYNNALKASRAITTEAPGMSSGCMYDRLC